MSERRTIVSALGHEYPFTLMGMQAADMDAAILAERQRVKPWHERLRRKLTGWQVRLAGRRGYTSPGTRVFLQATCLAVARTESRAAGRRTWYPLHIRWGWTRTRPPHVRVRRSYADR